MGQIKVTLLLGALLGSTAQADTAFYSVEDARLTIPDAVVLQWGRTSYYKNVTFNHNGNGVWRFGSGERSKLATVAAVDIVSEATVPPKVTAKLQGYKSLACVGLEAPAITRVGTTFHVTLAETAIPDNVRCITAIEPFALTLELDTEALTPGPYVVNANGTVTHFDLLVP